MNWEQHRTMLSSAPGFSMPSNSKLLNHPLLRQRYNCFPDMKAAPAARMFYQHPYLSYLPQRIKEFQPTVVTRPAELNLSDGTVASTSSSPRSYRTEGSPTSPLMLTSPNSRHLCQVCGDSASGVHYGVQTCEGCKSFFKRSLQGKGQTFVCAADNKCQVDKRLRRNCAACRLRVCHQVGMKSNGVRKRKLEKVERMTSKIFKVEPDCNQLELRDCRPMVRSGSDSAHLHQLPLSPISLVTPPSSPDPENSVAPSNSTGPSTLQTAESKIDEAIQAFVQQTTSQNGVRDTVGVDGAKYKVIDNNLLAGTALCQLFQQEIPGVVHWAKDIPGIKSLPIDDQIYLTRSRCLDLLIMSVVSQSCAHAKSESDIHFSIDDVAWEDLMKKKVTTEPQAASKMMKGNIQKAMTCSLKAYAADTFNNMQKVVTHYRMLDVSQQEMEILKLLLFTNTDINLESNVSRPEVVREMRNVFRDVLKSACVEQHGVEAGTRRYEELLLSLTVLKDLATRLESCMTQQSEVANTLNSISELLP